MLVRIVAVVSSSLATIFSSILPLYFHYDLSAMSVTTVATVLFLGALIVHGFLTHSLNDLTDYYSGTDELSPGILSGGSRVLQTGNMSLQVLRHISTLTSIILLLCIGGFLYFGQRELAILTGVGLWGAISYSARPFQLAYYPFAGEWFSLFPTMLFLGIAAPWILLDGIPLWAWQNASVNALFCMAWVMVHHIPDRLADRQAHPVKQTTAVWAEDTFGDKGTNLPCYLYFSFVALLLLWISFTRPFGALGAGPLLLYSLLQVAKMDTEDVVSITTVEKRLLLLAFSTAIWLGIANF